MTKINLFTALKNADLTAISAQDAIKGLLDIRYLNSLRRFTKWTLFTDEAVTNDALKSTIETITDTSIIICNPNKESLYFDSIPELKNTQKQRSFQLEVYPIKETDHSDILKKINKKSDIVFSKIKQHQFWELGINSNTPIKPLMKEIENKIIVSSSISQGILVNPLYENYSLSYQE